MFLFLVQLNPWRNKQTYYLLHLFYIDKYDLLFIYYTQVYKVNFIFSYLFITKFILSIRTEHKNHQNNGGTQRKEKLGGVVCVHIQFRSYYIILYLIRSTTIPYSHKQFFCNADYISVTCNFIFVLVIIIRITCDVIFLVKKMMPIKVQKEDSISDNK